MPIENRKLKEPNYFIFGNKPKGEYEDSIWDTSTILESKEYYFTTSDNLTYKPKKGDIVIFKEFNSKFYWGEAILDSDNEEIEYENDTVIRFKLKNIKRWLYTLETYLVHDKLSNKDTRARIVSITTQDYILIKDEMEKNNNLSEQRQNQIMELWERYKLSITDTEKQNISSQLEIIINQWNQYREKIINGKFSLDDYTNTLGNETATMPRGYLCKLLIRFTPFLKKKCTFVIKNDYRRLPKEFSRVYYSLSDRG